MILYLKVDSMVSRTSIGVTETVRKWKWKIRKHLRTGIDPMELTDPLELYGKWVTTTKLYRSKIKLSITLKFTSQELMTGNFYSDGQHNWLAVESDVLNVIIPTTHKEAKKIKAYYAQGTEHKFTYIATTFEL